MLVGMGTVFVFLTLLVAAMSIMSNVAQRFSPIPDAGDATNEEIAAITAAITQHRNKKTG